MLIPSGISEAVVILPDKRLVIRTAHLPTGKDPDEVVQELEAAGADVLLMTEPQFEDFVAEFNAKVRREQRVARIGSGGLAAALIAGAMGEPRTDLIGGEVEYLERLSRELNPTGMFNPMGLYSHGPSRSKKRKGTATAPERTARRKKNKRAKASRKRNKK